MRVYEEKIPLQYIIVKTDEFAINSLPFAVEGAESDRNYYSLAVGDDADVSTHTNCSSAPTAGATETDAKYVVPCRAVGRYLSIKRSGTEELRYMALCEVIVMGYVYNADNSSRKCDAISRYLLLVCIIRDVVYARVNYIYICIDFTGLLRSVVLNVLYFAK